MKKPIDQRLTVIKAFVSKQISIKQAVQILGCTKRSIQRYHKAFLAYGELGLTDHRSSNHHTLSASDKQRAIALKTYDRWRSARNVRDKLGLKISEQHLLRLFKKAGLVHQNIERVKPVQRFEAASPNDLWQTDIMGKINFPRLGTLYLIASLDDHSRFCLSGHWFKTQSKMNVFQMWYEALSRWGLPKAMLQDEGSQYKAHTGFGQADYQWYADNLKIKLIWAHRAQTKGKIERFWRFVQDDFVREVWHASTVEEVNGVFRVWLANYNYKFKGRSFGGQTRSDRYRPSERKVSRVELQTLLVVEERRKVTRESTISLYGKHYYVPPGYINCHIWVKVIGNKVVLEAAGEIFWKTKLKLS